MKNEDLLKKLGSHIRKVRVKKGLSQQDLAIDTDMAKSTIARIELAQLNPTFTTLQKISDALDIPLSKLVDF